MTLTFSVLSVLANMNLEAYGRLDNSDEQTYLFGTTLEDYEVTGALRVRVTEDNELNLACKFAVCSDNDVYDKELGIDIALGRAMRCNGDDASASGKVAIEDVVKSYLNAKLSGLEDVLAFKRRGEVELEEARQLIYSEVSDRIEEYV